MSAPEVSVVVPVLNERRIVDELITRLMAALPTCASTFEIIVIDDGSRDGTPERLRELEREEPRLRVIEFTRNFGQAPALACGIFAARGDIVVTMDGDLQDPPEEVPRLVAAIRDGADIVGGARQGLIQAPWRRAGGRIVHFAAMVLTGVRLEDYGGQFKAYTREVVEATRQAWGPGKPFFPLAVWLGFDVREVRVRNEPRRSGASRYDLATLVRVNLDLITSFTIAPLVAMLTGGLALTGMGLVLMLFGLAGGASTRALLAASTLTLAGSIFAAAGAVGVYVGRVYRAIAGSGNGYVVRRGPVRDDAHRDAAAAVASLDRS